MFGYVVPIKDVLSQNQQTLFQAYYCGLCKSMGRIARFTLTYDCAFLALALSNANAAEEKTQPCRCWAHPKEKKEIIQNEETRYAADINTILAYHKLSDDIADEKRWKARVARVLLRPAYRKAAARQRFCAEEVEQHMKNLIRLEQENCSVSDEIAHEFATLLAKVARYGLRSYENLEEFYKLFYNIGRWIYLADALADYQEDEAKGKYNVLRLECKSLDAAKEEMEFSLWHTLSEAEKNFQNITWLSHGYEIIENVIVKALPQRTRACLCQGGNCTEPV